MTFNSSPDTMNIMQLGFLINHGETANLIKTLEKNVQIFSGVVDGFMNAYLNKRLKDNDGDVDIEELFAVITNQDQDNVLLTVEDLLDNIFQFLNKK